MFRTGLAAAICLLFVGQASAQIASPPPPEDFLNEPNGATVHNDELVQSHSLCWKEEHLHVHDWGKHHGPLAYDYNSDVAVDCGKIQNEGDLRRSPLKQPIRAKTKFDSSAGVSDLDKIRATAAKLK